MKWRSLRNDKEVKPIWRNGMELLFWVFMLFNGAGIMLRNYNKHNNGVYGTAENVMFWIGLVALVPFIIIGVVYLIKPTFFK